MTHNFRNLKVWQKGIDVADEVYSFCELLPSDEKFNLQSQLKRSAVSIPSNIAEGCAKKSKNELVHYLGISLGSAYELETQLLICERRKMNSISIPFLVEKIHELQKMIFSFRQSLLVFALFSLFYISVR